MNLTDIDDRILDQAMHAGVTIPEYVKPYVAAFFEDMAALRAQPATHYPRPTEHIPEMVEMINELIGSENAYVADGDVYFRIASFPAYGALSHLDRAGLKPGIRVAADKYDKESVSDFALWKHSHPEDEKLGGAWDAPFGRERRIPGSAELLILRVRVFPEGEVADRLFVIFVRRHAYAGLEAGAVEVGQRAVGGKARDPEVNVAVRHVRVLASDELVDHLDHLGNVLGRTRIVRRGLRSQCGHVLEERGHVRLDVLRDGDPGVHRLVEDPVVDVR